MILMFVKLSYKILTNKVLCYFKLITLTALNFNDISPVLFEKRNLLSAIAAQRNDKRAYADSQMFKAMCKGDSFGLPQWGEKEDVEAITPESLYYHHGMLLEESPIEIFYVGSADPNILADKLRQMLRDLPRSPQAMPLQSPFRDLGGCEETEEMDVAQGKLCMGYVTPITLRCPDFAAMQVLNTMLGAGMTSKLFMQVREKLSLCYDIGSVYHGSKGILLVSAGIDFDQEENVRRQTEHQLQLCREGGFTEEELLSAKEQLLTQLRATHDAPSSIESYYATAALSGLGMDTAEYMDAVQAVTGRDVCRAAQSLQLHSVFFLRGDA